MKKRRKKRCAKLELNCAELTFTASATEQHVEEEEEGEEEEEEKIFPRREKNCNVQKKEKKINKYSLSSLRVMVQHLSSFIENVT